MTALPVGRTRCCTAMLIVTATFLQQACGDGAGPRDVATPAALVLTTPPPASAPNRVAFVPQPVVQLRDADGAAVAQAGTVVTVAITTGGGTVGGTTTTTTASTGAATFTDLSIAGTAGEKTLTFSANGVTSATAAVTLTAGAATNIAVNTGNDQSAVPGAAVPTGPSVKVTDADANPVGGVAVTFAVVSGGGSITDPSQTTDESGIASVRSWTLGPTAGTNTLAATAEGLTGSPVTFTARGTSGGGGGSPQSIVGSNAYTCALANDGTAYCWGFNALGMLGDGTTTDRLTPVAVAGGLTFKTLSAGFFHVCGVTTGGSAYCWGANKYGHLGDGTMVDRPTPVSVSEQLTFQSVSAGYAHSCGLTSGGAAYCWGYNLNGQLGDGTTSDRTTPTAVAGGLIFKSLTANGWHTCAVTVDGDAYCWGLNADGQLGDGTIFTNRAVPVAVGGGFKFHSLTAGHHYTCGLSLEGAARCWGDNTNGQLGDGTRTQRLTPAAVTGGLKLQSLAAGGSHTCGVTTEGAAYCWGSALYSQLGSLFAGIDSPEPTPVLGELTFQSITAGYSHSCGVTTDAVAYCWGFNGLGGLGDGTTAERSTPQPVRWP
jgi:alpha-tubulin suppressor-like RCC1 family protein